MEKKEKSYISLFYLLMISSAFVVSIRNLPSIAETKVQMIFFGIIASIMFFIPGALVSAELATGWPKMGGIATWVKEAFGKKWGFAASWLQWTYAMISMIAQLYFIASSLAFLFDRNLANNRAYLIISELILIWLFTILSLKGLKISKMVSTIGFLSGVLFPAILIIGFGIAYIVQGGASQIDFSLKAANYFPDIHHISSLVLLVAFMRAFAGIEGSAVHANRVENPQRNYPIAIFIVVIFGLSVNILGSMSVAIAIPSEKISLVSSVVGAFEVFLQPYKLEFLIPIIGLLAGVGQIGGFATWIIGPVKGLYVMSVENNLPHYFQKLNKYEVPSHLLIFQAVVISILGTLFLLFAGTINQAFWISVAFSMLIYVSMYFLMFLSALYLRIKQPHVERKYKIPGGKIGIGIVTILGMISMILSFIIAFFPPSQLPTEHRKFYFSFLMIGIIIIYILPILITSMFKKRKA